MRGTELAGSRRDGKIRTRSGRIPTARHLSKFKGIQPFRESWVARNPEARFELQAWACNSTSGRLVKKPWIWRTVYTLGLWAVELIRGDARGIEKNYGQLVLPSRGGIVHFLSYSMLLLSLLLVINRLFTLHKSDLITLLIFVWML